MFKRLGQVLVPGFKSSIDDLNPLLVESACGEAEGPSIDGPSA